MLRKLKSLVDRNRATTVTDLASLASITWGFWSYSDGLGKIVGGVFGLGLSIRAASSKPKPAPQGDS